MHCKNIPPSPLIWMLMLFEKLHFLYAWFSMVKTRHELMTLQRNENIKFLSEMGHK